MSKEVSRRDFLKSLKVLGVGVGATTLFLGTSNATTIFEDQPIVVATCGFGAGCSGGGGECGFGAGCSGSGSPGGGGQCGFGAGCSGGGGQCGFGAGCSGS